MVLWFIALTILICCSLGVNIYLLYRVVQFSLSSKFLSHAIHLRRFPALIRFHESCFGHLTRVSQNPNEIFQQLANQRLGRIENELAMMSAGRIEFSSTERWRSVYEAILRSPEVFIYRSVAYIETPHYWQDGAGQQSTRLNLDLHEEGLVAVERTAIIADHLWPKSEDFPVDSIHKWLDQQHRYGIYIQIMRESEIENEPDLRVDFGIYGKCAVGTQFADPAGRTIRFILDFDFSKVKQAEQNWEQLAAYSTPYINLLDRKQ